MGIPGRRALPVRARGERDKGTCRVCRERTALSTVTGKVLRHKRSADRPTGCAGEGTRPMTRAELRAAEAESGAEQ